tara:strand:+ start:119 stop:742 length:624 start_codon:yes stop_codon:yes gene_type:complete
MISLRRLTTIASVIALSSLSIPESIAREKQKGFYANIGAGYARHIDISIDSASGGGKIKFDPGFAGDIGVGYDFGSIRTELGYNFISNDVSSVQGYGSTVGVEFKSLFLTAFYDFRADKKWQPYVGLGIGATEITATSSYAGNISLSAGDDNITSAVFKAGVSYHANEQMDIYGEVWGQAYDDFTIGSYIYSDCGVGGMTLGARLKF